MNPPLLKHTGKLRSLGWFVQKDRDGKKVAGEKKQFRGSRLCREKKKHIIKILREIIRAYP